MRARRPISRGYRLFLLALLILLVPYTIVTVGALVLATLAY
jgi:hypothetical protein